MYLSRKSNRQYEKFAELKVARSLRDLDVGLQFSVKTVSDLRMASKHFSGPSAERELLLTVMSDS